MRQWIIVAFGLGLLGCDPVLNSEKLESSIKSELAAQSGVTPESVDCPESVGEKKGGTFTCTATAPDGGTAIITVTMMGGGEVDWAVTKINK